MPVPVVEHELTRPNGESAPSHQAADSNGDGPASDADGLATRLRSTLQTLQLVIAPSTLITALLFYFGWEFSNARLMQFGVDQSLLGYSTRDYLLRSIDPVAIPLSTMLVVAVAAVWAHSSLRRLVLVRQHPQALERVTLGIVAAGGLLTASGLAATAGRYVLTRNPIVVPLELGFGVGVIVYGASLRRVLKAAPSAPERTSVVIATLAAGLVILSLFGATGEWARAVGRGRAMQLAQNLDARRPSAVVYSKQKLQLWGPGLESSVIGDDQSVYRFRYAGLKFLVRAEGRLVFVPAGWSPGRGTVIVLRDDDGIRVEYSPGRKPSVSEEGQTR